MHLSLNTSHLLIYNGKSYPRIDKIEIMANFFDISKADLVEEPSKKQNKF